ncbi:E3 SUMO-protein ligase PIAS1-like [Daktulosphaira vitifoliae]|uniref:E3 SUMO-protein ligase PIAS1-like n=1 Tax=Daktulosphaira vitifoliae TaxID=58002 RepID=UPI0021AAF85A|nr:E3 SUMO-protein ligase PIAS1-like [Daktulosphaira vitifoliae]XP_050528417.1 E3 SUMO-protein ligase PIAS1-like [Daktulosphaira vitifoliae]XP_050528418.1 E3 SUMO-protein ligase PIAS1-like [Daktulosphaira vitifoliae]
MSSYNEGQTELAYRTMLGSFRTHDLQALLGAFGRNKAGRKSELKERALDLLRNRPVGFNYHAYLTKITEIFRSIQSDIPITNNDMMRNMMQSQQQHMMPMNMQQSQQSRMYQPQQFTQQAMHLSRTGLPQVIPQMQRGMYGSNNMQYGYQTPGSRGIVSQVSTNQHLVKQDVGSYDINTANNMYNQATHSQVNVKLKKLPFYEVISEVVKPTTLIGQERCSLQNVPRGMRESSFKLLLLPEHATHIAMNRDISNGKNEYLYQMQIRICQLEPGPEISDFMPLGLHIRACGKVCPLPPNAPNTRPGTESRRTPRPINCTQLLKLNPNIINTITINWIPDGKTYVLGIYLVKKLSSETLLSRLQEKGARSSEETKNNIIKKLADVDPDLATTSYRFSLVCPLGKMRMTIPAKSINCDHLQCFDASIFILMNEKKPTWMCPTCNKACLYDDIRIESYFLDVVTSPSLPDNCKEIEIIADGTWRVFEERNKTKHLENTPKDKPIDSVNLDDSDDDDTVKPDESKNEPKEKPSQVSKEPEKLNTFVDLTISDDEDMPLQKEKLENEAQAIDAEELAPIVEISKPTALVQPRQAVTSSEQSIIEIDSPSPPASPLASREKSKSPTPTCIDTDKTPETSLKDILVSRKSSPPNAASDVNDHNSTVLIPTTIDNQSTSSSNFNTPILDYVPTTVIMTNPSSTICMPTSPIPTNPTITNPSNTSPPTISSPINSLPTT